MRKRTESASAPETWLLAGPFLSFLASEISSTLCVTLYDQVETFRKVTMKNRFESCFRLQSLEPGRISKPVFK